MARMQNGWENAPLIYVVGMLRFSRITFNDKISDIHESLRHKFPLLDEHISEAQQVSVSPSGPSYSKNSVYEWTMASPDETTGVLIREDGIFLHTVSYTDSESFIETFSQVIRAVNTAVDIAYYHMLGLRYIDIIQAAPDRPLEAYIKPQLRQMNIATHGEKQNTLIQMEVQSENTMLFSRCAHIEELPESKVPMDLAPLFEKLNTKHVSGQVGEAAIILDTDCIYNTNQMQIFNIETIRSVFENDLHSQASRAFKNATRKKAREEWK